MKKCILLTLFLSMGLSADKKEIKRIAEDISETLRHTEIYPDGTLKTVYTYKMKLSRRERGIKLNDKSLGYIFTTGVNRGNRDMEWNRPHEYIFLYKTEYDRNGNLLSFTEGNSDLSIKKNDYVKTLYAKDEKGKTFVTKIEKYKDGEKKEYKLIYN